ncbi:major facilitator superfamily domain-containing protein [Paraphoma chrysanthemicola]|uniref:Major facilitator superfamily domain-containing protein n=1 Tax=Paraphoma chrysanthemicola TaxID=798071 RepID=A0A8K0W543_9PLEO|nr:major facilitator superfamily domain-containing protein [Paraphoma chrysanthemicola]
MATSPTSFNGLYPDGELARPPRALPLRKPSVISHHDEIDAGDEILPFSTSDELPLATTQSRKRESYNMSGSVFLITSMGQTLKLPIPSESPADPLGWGKWKRAGAFLAVFWFSAVSLTVAQAMSVLLGAIAEDFVADNLGPWHLETLVTAPTLFMAIGAFLWVPLSIGVGRRPAFLLASLVMMLATIGAGYASTFHQLLACSCFHGLGEGFALSTAMLIVIDLTFVGDRPSTMACLWAVAGFFGTTFVAIIPYMSDQGRQWRLFYHIWSAPTTIAFLLVFFLFPETYFKRPTVAFDGLIVMQSATEKLTVFKDVEAESEIYRDLPQPPKTDDWLGKYSFSRSPFASWTSMGWCYVQIALCIVNPLIFWVFIAAGVNFAGMLFIGSTHGRILSAPPYNLSTALITPVNLSCAIGGLLAWPIGIPPVNAVLDRLAKRNRGVREAEHFLVLFVLPVITGAMSTLLYGLAVHYKLHYVSYYFAYGLNGFSWVALAIGMTLWATEAFPRWAAPALAVLSGGVYLIGFCMSFALMPWIAAHGYKLVGIELTVLQIVGGLVAVPVAFWGKSARQVITGRWGNERSGALRPL